MLPQLLLMTMRMMARIIVKRVAYASFLDRLPL